MAHAYPESLQLAYYNITAHTPTGVAIGPIKIHKYRNTSHSDVDTSADAGLDLKNKIIGALRDRYKKITGSIQKGEIISIDSTKQSEWFEGLRNRDIDKTAIVRAFSGKGSLQDIELALDAGLATGKIKPNLIDIQKVCDVGIGLDCNGFVGNFTKYQGMMAADGHYGPNSEPKVFAARGVKRDKMEDIRVKDVFLWPGSSQHIAIVSYVWGMDGWFYVTESAASLGGLNTRWYQFTGKSSYGDTMVKGGGNGRMFEVRRPTKSGSFYKAWILPCKLG